MRTHCLFCGKSDAITTTPLGARICTRCDVYVDRVCSCGRTWIMTQAGTEKTGMWDVEYCPACDKYGEHY